MGSEQGKNPCPCGVSLPEKEDNTMNLVNDMVTRKYTEEKKKNNFQELSGVGERFGK